MIRAFIFLLVFLVLQACGLDSARVLENNIANTVRVESYSASGWQLVGTGTLVDGLKKPLVLTARHVAEGEALLRVCLITKDTSCSFVEVVAEGKNRVEQEDWLLLSLDEQIQTVRPSQVAKVLPNVGEALIVIGNPGGHSWVSQGLVAWKEDDLIKVDTFCYPGSSGGGVYNSKGEIIGIIIASHILPAPGIGLHIPQENMCVALPITSVGWP